jgi:hypothetical protein
VLFLILSHHFIAMASRHVAEPDEEPEEQPLKHHKSCFKKRMMTISLNVDSIGKECNHLLFSIIKELLSKF